jgi:gluconate 2-dehydrogenase gamma chain
MASRRESLKIIGAIGTTCAFPFSADELYGQHVHLSSPAPPEGLYTPKFFSTNEFETLSRITELIIPTTNTPGAIGAGVPRYIDGVVSTNPEHKKRFREGLAWLDRESGKRFRKTFARLTEAQQVKLLTPLSEAVDSRGKLGARERFFALVKNMTADGYYTSRIGLVQELGYSGNTALDKFPSCEIG